MSVQAASPLAATARLPRGLRWASLTFAGLFAGFLLAVLVVESALRSYGASTYVSVRLVELDGLDRLATVTLLPALATSAIAVGLGFARGTRPPAALGVAVALLALVLLVSLTVNLPINAQQRGWSVSDPPSDWANVRDRWQLAHLVRTVSAVAAFTILSATNTLRSHP
jgi:hypothetical protein